MGGRRFDKFFYTKLDLQTAISGNNYSKIEALARQFPLNDTTIEETIRFLPHPPFSFTSRPGVKSEKLSALGLAVLKSDLETVKLLLDLGADPNAFRGQALFYTTHPKAKDGLEKLLVLLEAGASLEALGDPMEFGFYLAGAKDELGVRRAMDALSRKYGGSLPDKFVGGFLAGATYWGSLSLLEDYGKNRENFFKRGIDQGENTLLHYAAASSVLTKNSQLFQKVVNYLVEKGLEINVRNKNGGTPLHVLCTHASEREIRLFLGYGADANARDKEGRTPLTFATLWQSKKIDPEHKDYVKLVNKFVGVLQALVEGGADPNLPDKFGRTPLYRYLKTEEPLPEVVKALVKIGCSPNQSPPGEDPIIIAVLRQIKGWEQEKRNWEIIHFLLENGADPLSEDRGGKSFLSVMAERFGEYITIDEAIKKMADIAISRGASITARDSNGFSPLHNAAKAGGPLFSYYLSYAQPSDIDAPAGPEGRTVLHMAAAEGNTREVVLAVRHGGDINLKTATGETPLTLLLEQGLDNVFNRKSFVTAGERKRFFDDLWELLRLIEERGLRLYDDFGKKTLLHSLGKGALLVEEVSPGRGRLNGYEKTIADLIKHLVEKHGVPINAKDERGWTLLHYISSIPNWQLIRTAINLGAEPWIANFNGETPGDLLFRKVGKDHFDREEAISLGLFPVKEMAALSPEEIEHGVPGAKERMKIFLAELFKKEPLVAMELTPRLASVGGFFSQAIEEIIGKNLRGGDLGENFKL